MNKLEIDKEIERRIAAVKSPDELRELQQWAKAEKNKIEAEPYVTEFRHYYYSRRVRNGGRHGGRGWYSDDTVNYKTFFYLGVEIPFNFEINVNFKHPVDLPSKPVWMGRHLKYACTAYYPPDGTKQMWNIDFEKKFLAHAAAHNFFMFEKGKKRFLCEFAYVAQASLMGRRSAKDAVLVPLTDDQMRYLDGKVPLKTMNEVFGWMNEEVEDVTF